ncbi:MAG TPA: glycosyltransferase, partial [Phycicoccus sp.]|nr:glycosyltransferase [Phycicoccus sp.]
MAGWVLVKVALLSDCYLPRLGGIEVQVHDLAHHLTRAGHTVEVFTATGDPAQPRSTHPTADDVGMRVHRFDLGLPGGIPINPLAVPEIRRRLG